MKTSLAGALALAAGVYPFTNPPVVSIVKIRNGNIKNAVDEAIRLIGGVDKVLMGKQHIMLKPNLVGDDPRCTTKPEVIKALAELFKNSGKEVCIAEGSAAADGFNWKNNVQYRTKKAEILDPMQQHVFDKLGYTSLAKELNIPLINLHSGEMVDLPVPEGLMFDKITVHKSVAETDLLCSVPMEGNGPTDGELVEMNLIIAGTNPLATDMVAANIMGFETQEIPTFNWAIKVGMKPSELNDIEIRGETIASVRRKFKKPEIVPWNSINKLWGVEEL